MWGWVDDRFPSQMVARRNLARTKLRSALAGLGIVIGVVAIASLGMFGATLQTQATQSLGGIGNQVVVSPATYEGVQSIPLRDVRSIELAAPDATVVPVKAGTRLVTVGRKHGQVRAYGIERPAKAYEASTGRFHNQFKVVPSSGDHLQRTLIWRSAGRSRRGERPIACARFSIPVGRSAQ
jgi:putative ABC transport system permease protein